MKDRDVSPPCRTPETNMMLYASCSGNINYKKIKGREMGRGSGFIQRGLVSSQGSS